MRRIFIGDLHLQESRPDITEGFIRFLREECLRCDELYILGDLFEAWIGDDERADLSERVAWELQRLRRPGKYFIRGNRDFLIGKGFCDLAGLTLLPDISEVRLGRSSAVILHGDHRRQKVPEVPEDGLKHVPAEMLPCTAPCHPEEDRGRNAEKVPERERGEAAGPDGGVGQRGH